MRAPLKTALASWAPSIIIIIIIIIITLQCKFTLRITHDAPLITRSVFLAMLYLTVVTPVSLSFRNDTWKDNTNTNKDFQD